MKPDVIDHERRRFLAGTIQISLAALLAPRTVFAETIGRTLCDEAPTVTPSLLTKGCEARIEDPELRMRFLEAIRSAPAFEEAAAFIPTCVDLSDRKLQVLYPGAGHHIAPLTLAAKLIETRHIDECEFVFTEIDECELIKLRTMLMVLPRIDANFTFVKESPGTDCKGTKGRECIYELQYKGRTIRIRLLMNCSGKNWFRDSDLHNADLLICHDVFSDVDGPYYFLYQNVMRAKAGSLQAKPMILEDTTRKNGLLPDRPKVRYFDLELFGTIQRTQSPYGHRTSDNLRADRLSPMESCLISQAVVAQDKNIIEILKGKTLEDVDRWKRGEKLPEPLMLFAEVDYPFFNNGAVLNIFPELLSFDCEDIATLIDISRMACGREGERMVTLDNPQKDYHGILSAEDAYKAFVARAAHLLESFKEMNPLLCRALAVRIIQDIFEYIESNIHPMRGATSRAVVREFRRLEELFHLAKKYLDSSDISALAKDLHDLKLLLRDMRVTAESRENRGKLRRALFRTQERFFGKMYEGGITKMNELRDRFYTYGNQLFEAIV